MYIPPFTVSAEAINLIAEISDQIERYAITASTNVGQSGPFIDFMLNEIFKTLKQHQGESLPLASDSNPIDKEFGIKFGINDKSLLLLLNSNPSSTAADAAEQLGMTQRGAEKLMKRLKEAGVISREGSRKNGIWIINK